MEKHFILNTANYYRTYFLDDKKRPMAIICPGGGYKYTSPRESEPVVKRFLENGFHSCVINYRETLDIYPNSGNYIGYAINEMRKSPLVDKIIGVGFSAGGHAILEYCLHYDSYNYNVRPDLLILGYPVITSDKKYAHLGSFEELLKEKSKNRRLRRYLSLEYEVNKNNAVDLFLWGTYTDKSVPVENSLRLIEAYRKVDASIEYHLFPFGGHGLSVANAESSDGKKELESPYIAKWFDLAIDWLNYKLN